LALATQEFFIKRALPKSIPEQVQKTQSLRNALTVSLCRIKETRDSAYNPTPIWQTRYSEFWQWQRVSEWHREYGQDDITNEKRHIIL
jgi:endo-beta-N-acetylglucosaminidase D